MRKSEPWLRKFKAKEGKPARKPCWYLEIDGKQFRLHEKKVEAWRIYHELISRGELSVNSGVGHILDDFLESIKQNRSARTFECYRYFLQSFLGSLGKAIRVRDLKPRHVTAWLRKTSWSDTTKNIAVRSIKSAFSWAAREGIIDRSPIDAVQAPEASHRERIISPDEWQRIIEAIPDQEFRDFLTVLRETGCRPHEARIVVARNVHVDRWILLRNQSKGKKTCRVVRLKPSSVAGE